ncbi:unnamed protein product [Rhizopus stolonifer]
MGSPSIITNPMFNVGFLLVSMQLAKKVDFSNPDVLTMARIGYYSAQVLVVAMAYDTTVLTYTPPAKAGFGAPAAAPEAISTTFTQPLLMQSMNPIKNLFTHKEALIHLWGDAPEGNLARPFTAENPLGGLSSMLGMGNEATDNHAHRE